MTEQVLAETWPGEKDGIESKLAEIAEALKTDAWTFECVPSAVALADAAAATGSSYSTTDRFWSNVNHMMMCISGEMKYMSDELKAPLVACVSKRLIKLTIEDIDGSSMVPRLEDGAVIYACPAKSFNNNDQYFNKRLDDALLADPSVAVSASLEKEKDGIESKLKDIADAYKSEPWTYECVPSNAAVCEAAAATGSWASTPDRFGDTIKTMLMHVSGELKYLSDDLKPAVIEAAPKRCIRFSIDDSIDGSSMVPRLEDGCIHYRCPAKAFNSNDQYFNKRLDDALKSNPAVALGSGLAKEQGGIDTKLKTIGEAFGTAPWTYECVPSAVAMAEAAAATGSDYSTVDRFYSNVSHMLMLIMNELKYLNDALKKPLLAEVPKQCIRFSIDNSIEGRSMVPRLEDGVLHYACPAKAFNNNDQFFDKRVDEALKAKTAPPPQAAPPAASASAAASAARVQPKRSASASAAAGSSPAAQLMARRKDLEATCKATIDEVAGTGQFASIPRETLEGWSDAFQKYDEDASGDIDQQELTKMMEAIGMPARVLEVRALMREFDADGSGTIDFREFLTLCAKRGLSKGMTAPPPSAKPKAPLWASGPSAGGRVGGGGGGAAAAAPAAAAAAGGGGFQTPTNPELVSGLESEKRSIESKLKELGEAYKTAPWTFECVPSPDAMAAEVAAGGSSYGSVDRFYSNVSHMLMLVNSEMKYLDDGLKEALKPMASKRCIRFSVDDDIDDPTMVPRLEDGCVHYACPARAFNNNDQFFSKTLSDVLLSDPGLALARGEAEYKGKLEKHLSDMSAVGGAWQVELEPSALELAQAASAANPDIPMTDFYRTVYEEFLMCASKEVYYEVGYRSPAAVKEALLAKVPTRTVVFAIDNSVTGSSIKPSFRNNKLYYTIAAKNFWAGRHQFQETLVRLVMDSDAGASAAVEEHNTTGAGAQARAAMSSAFAAANAPRPAGTKQCPKCKLHPGKNICGQCKGQVGRCRSTVNCKGKGWVHGRCQRCKGTGKI